MCSLSRIRCIARLCENLISDHRNPPRYFIKMRHMSNGSEVFLDSRVFTRPRAWLGAVDAPPACFKDNDSHCVNGDDHCRHCDEAVTWEKIPACGHEGGAGQGVKSADPMSDNPRERQPHQTTEDAHRQRQRGVVCTKEGNSDGEN